MWEEMGIRAEVGWRQDTSEDRSRKLRAVRDKVEDICIHVFFRQGM